MALFMRIFNLICMMFLICHWSGCLQVRDINDLIEKTKQNKNGNNHVWIKKSCVQKCERSFNQSDSYILFEMVPASCFSILVPRANAARISARLLGHHQWAWGQFRTKRKSFFTKFRKNGTWKRFRMKQKFFETACNSYNLKMILHCGRRPHQSVLSIPLPPSQHLWCVLKSPETWNWILISGPLSDFGVMWSACLKHRMRLSILKVLSK